MALGSLLVLLTVGLSLPQRSSRFHLPQLFPEQDARAIAWPAHLPVLAKGRTVVGDVTGDLQPDAVLLNGGFPVVAYAPAIHQALFQLELEANDLALLPATQPGRAQTLALAGPGGLSLLSDFEGGQFAEAQVGGPAWLGATRVRAADTDKDGVADLVGLSLAHELLFLEQLVGAQPVETILPIGAPVLDFVPIDWDGAPELRVAVLTSSGLSVRSRAGTVLFAIDGAVDGGTLAVVRQAGLAFERLALVFELSGTQFLLVLDRTGVEAPLSLVTDLVFALTAGDADLDANDDLYLLHGYSHDTVLFLNSSARPFAAKTFGFGQTKTELVDVAPTLAPAPLWSAWPALADLSLDGDPEALVFVEASNELVFIENTRRPLARSQVEVLGGAYVFDEGLLKGELRLDVRQPQTLAFVATHVEIVGWKQADAIATGLESAAAATAVVHSFCALAPDGSADCRIPVHEGELFTPSIHHFDLRAVRVESGAVVNAGPSTVHAFTTPESLVDLLEEQFGEGVELRVFVIEDGVERELTADELADRQLAPKAVKTDKIPEIDSPPNPFD